MKIVASPRKMKNFLAKSLVYSSSPLLSSTHTEIKPEGIIVEDAYMEALTQKGVYNKNYFEEYEIDEPLTVPFTASLYDVIKSAFDVEKIEMKFTGLDNENLNDKIVLRGIEDGEVKETYDEGMTEKPFSDFMNWKKKSDGITGYIESPNEFDVEGVINTGELSSLPSAEEYKFISDGDTFKVVMRTDPGNYEKDLSFNNLEKLNDLQVTYDGKLLRKIFSNVPEVAQISMSNDIVNFTTKGSSYMHTFVLAAMVEGQ